MMPNPIRSRGRSLVTAWALFLSLGCGSAPQSSLAPSSTLGGQPQVLARSYTGTVHLSQSAANVEVRLLTADSDLELAKVTTNGAGIFELPQGMILPARFRISASTPEGVQVERFVDQGELPHLWINIPTHLISLFIRRHPEATVQLAQTALRRALALKDGEGFYGTSDSTNSSFSHKRFLQAVQTSGLGFEGYCQKLVSDMENGAVVSFRPPSSNVLTETSIGLSVVGFLGRKLGNKIFDSSVDFVVGQIFAAAGLNIGSDKNFKLIENELSTISAELTQLSQTVNQGFLNGLIVLASDSLKGVIRDLASIQSDMASQATTTQGLYALQPDVYDHGPAVVSNSINTKLANLGKFVAGNALQAFQEALTSPDRTQNLLLLANQQARIQLTPQGQPNDAYDLRRDDLTDQIQAHFQLYLGYCAQLGQVISESACAGYLPQGLSVPGFNPPSGAINEALKNIVQTSTIVFNGHQLVAEPVGTPLVLIDRENKLMWYLKAQLCKYDGAQNGMIGLEVNNWALPPGVSPPEPLETVQSLGGSITSFVNFRRPQDMPGWRLPERDELRLLYSRVVALGGGNKDPEKTLTALKTLGFQGLSEDQSQNYKKFWYNGAVFPRNSGAFANPKFHEYDMSKDSDGDEVDDYFNNPNYTAIYVRSLDPNAPPFGDTVDQFHKSYALGLKSLSLGQVTPHDDRHQYFLREYYLLGNLDVPPQRAPYPSNLSDRAVWSLEGVNPPGCAFLTFRSDANTVIASVNFRSPGQATLKASISYPITASISQSVSTSESTAPANVAPALQSIMISPQNLAYQTVPQNPGFQQFYCTGYLANGETVDLTNLVQWSIQTPPPANYHGNNPARITSGGPTGGDLLFGDSGSLAAGSNVTIQARYQAGSVPIGATWSDAGHSFSDSSVFHLP